MSLVLRFLHGSFFILFVFGTQSYVFAASDCPNGYTPQTNPFSRWSGCNVALYGNGTMSSNQSGEWTAGFNFGDFITVRGNAYCLQEQYAMPSQNTSCGNAGFPVVANVDTTKSGSVCWCRVTGWQPFTPDRKAPFKEVDAKYIQMPVTSQSCNLQDCGYICASIGDSTAASIDLLHTNAGLRGDIYKSVLQCVPNEDFEPTDCPYGYEYNTTTSQCDAIEYTVSYVLNGGTNNSNNPSSYTIETPTITLKDPAKSGNVFVGWFDENDDRVTEIATKTYGEKTLNARWTNAENCEDWEHGQTNPFSRWSGCNVALHGNGTTTSNQSGEWTAGFNFGDFITVKGNAYCLQEQYPMPSQNTSCDNAAFPVVADVDTTKSGSVCWCKVTAWQPFTPDRNAPFEEVDAKYIQMPITSQSCNLQDCGYICASIGDSTGTSIDLLHTNVGLRGDIYKSVKQCAQNKGYVPTDCPDEYVYNNETSKCEPVSYKISYELNGGTNNNNNPLSYTIETSTITLQDPTKSGFDFGGWYTTANFTEDSKITQITKGTTGAKKLYAKWTEAYTGTDCPAGYYLSQSSNECVICEENHYCTGGINSVMQSCSTGLVSPEGTVSADHCGKIMLVGEDVLYLTQTQQTTPALAVKLDGKTYYAKTTPLSQIEQPAEHFLRTKIDGVEYSIHDNTVQRRN